MPRPGVAHAAAPLRNISLAPSQCGGPFARAEKFGDTCGGAAECCSLCTAEAQCTAWTYLPPHVADGPRCMLFSGSSDDFVPLAGAFSGDRGEWTTANWTSMPQAFRKNGYFTLGTGKVFHDGTGGVLPGWTGPGMPPLQDPPSWSPGCSMQDVDSAAYMWGCDTPVGSLGAAKGCAVNATEAGDVGAGEKPLADKIVADDALSKLEIAARTLRSTGRQFYLAAGFRKPHMSWRFPAPFLKYYPPAAKIKVAAHPTMDHSVPPIAHHDPTLQPSPYVPMATELAQTNRLFYYAAVSWVDSQIGRVLDRLDSLGLTNETALIFHSDHGWSLGEHVRATHTFAPLLPQNRSSRPCVSTLGPVAKVYQLGARCSSSANHSCAVAQELSRPAVGHPRRARRR